MMNYKTNNILVTDRKGIGQATTNLLISKGSYVYALIKNKAYNKKFRKYENLKIINGDVNNLNLIKKFLMRQK